MRAVVEVDGEVGDLDFRSYAVRSARNGATSVLSFEVDDSLELVRVLQAVVAHRLNIKHAQLHR
jgi:hypothetical protein